MKTTKHHRLALLFVICFFFLFADSNFVRASVYKENSGEKVYQSLQFSMPANSEHIVFNLKISEKQRKDLKREKIEELSDAIICFADSNYLVKDIHVRGNNSRSFPRKSFSVSLNESITFIKGDSSVSLKHFHLISLSMDKNYFRNRLAFGLLNKIGIYNLFYQYIELQINSQTQGVYLLVEKPQKYAMKTENADFVIRRAYNGGIEKVHSKKSLTQADSLNYISTFNEIYSLVDSEIGLPLYEGLCEILNMENYMKWLSFNYLVCNGDYTDELYLYAKKTNNRIKFDIIPWDYDDIFMPYPHEGAMYRSLVAGGEMIFSIEDKLDKTLAKDVYCYKQYLKVLNSVSEILSADVVKAECEAIYAELFSFYNQKDIIKISKYDKYEILNLQQLQIELNKAYYSIIQRSEKVNFQLANN